MSQLQVLPRADLLEQQNQLLVQKFEAIEQMEQHKTYIKSLREDVKDIDGQLRDLRVKLESNQVTLGVK